VAPGRQTFAPFIAFLGLLVVVRSVVVDWNYVSTSSMQPTIAVGDHIIVDRLAYDLRLPFTRLALRERAQPQRGDIVAFSSPVDETLYVKRVIGLPGDRIALIDHVLQINGEAATVSAVRSDEDRSVMEEVFAGHAHMIAIDGDALSPPNLLPLRVPPDAYLVLGDNRNQSFDSRQFGFVDRDRILGRVTHVAFSIDSKNGFRPRPDRLFQLLR